MCLFKTPKAAELKPLPPAPSEDDEAVKQREALERQRLLAGQGTAGTVKTDLAPSSLVGQKRVLLGV